MKKFLIAAAVLGVAMPGMAKDFCQAGNPAVDVEYPIVSAERRETGVVFIETQLDDDGVPQSVKLLKGSGYQRLDDAAMAAAKANPIHCTEGYAGDSYIDAITFDIDAKRTNRQIKYSTRVNRVIEPLAVGLANAKRLWDQCFFEYDNVTHIYPPDAIAAHIQGTLMAEVVIAADNSRQVRIVDGSGDSRLDMAAANIAKKAALSCGMTAPPKVFRIPFRFYIDEAGINTKEEAGAVRVTNYGYIIKPGFYSWTEMDRARAEIAR